MISFLRTAIKKVLNLVLPCRCYGCGRAVDGQYLLCDECLPEVAFVRPPYCRICMAPASRHGGLCGNCLRRKPRFKALRSAAEYDGLAKKLVLRFKHADRTDIARIFAMWLKFAAADALENVDLLVAVPLHPLRKARRKYNQAALVASELGGMTGIPFAPGVLVRTRWTPSQGHRTRAERKSNVAKAFAVKNPPLVKGKRVAVLDDVITTGATLLECLAVLKRAGAREVTLLTVARA